ncbi:hypothetical protein AVEN_199864-1 [Araneus ventricosus]|uniref:Uncharacterized protein n=1 Tax=Araneus ventricosus TaxID=182803 RepID=A0A4Y2M9F8_ARAVE|nr:hypothetical protein AVEN_199864-1 [Araneus ventricosus]
MVSRDRIQRACNLLIRRRATAGGEMKILVTIPLRPRDKDRKYGVHDRIPNCNLHNSKNNCWREMKIPFDNHPDHRDKNKKKWYRVRFGPAIF